MMALTQSTDSPQFHKVPHKVSAEKVVTDYIDEICKDYVINKKPEYKDLLQLLSQNLKSVIDTRAKLYNFRNLTTTQNNDLRAALQNADSLIQEIDRYVRVVSGRAKSLFCWKSVTQQELIKYSQLVMRVEKDLKSFIEMESEAEAQKMKTELETLHKKVNAKAQADDKRAEKILDKMKAAEQNTKKIQKAQEKKVQTMQERMNARDNEMRASQNALTTSFATVQERMDTRDQELTDDLRRLQTSTKQDHEAVQGQLRAVNQRQDTLEEKQSRLQDQLGVVLEKQERAQDQISELSRNMNTLTQNLNRFFPQTTQNELKHPYDNSNHSLHTIQYSDTGSLNLDVHNKP